MLEKLLPKWLSFSATFRSFTKDNLVCVQIPSQIIKKLESEHKGLAKAGYQIKEEYGDVQVLKSDGKYYLTGTDKYYLDLVIATLDHKYVQPSAPDNGVIQLIEDKKLKWKFFGYNAALLKHMFDTELNQIEKHFKCAVNGLTKKTLVVEISCERECCLKAKVEIEKIQNSIIDLHRVAITVEDEDESSARHFVLSPIVGDKSSYIQYNKHNHKLMFFAKTDESLKIAMDTWQTKIKGSVLKNSKPSSYSSQNRTGADGSKQVTIIHVKTNNGFRKTPAVPTVELKQHIPRAGITSHDPGAEMSQYCGHSINGGTVVGQVSGHSTTGEQQTFSQTEHCDTDRGQGGPAPQNTMETLSQSHVHYINHGITGVPLCSSYRTTAHNRSQPTQSPRKDTAPDPDRGSTGHAGSTGAGLFFSYGFDCGSLLVKVYDQSITEIRGMDAIVNAANDNLQHGGGVAYYISKAAGPTMDRECNQFVSRHGPLPVTESFVSGPGRMHCRGIIHAVGPQWCHYVDNEENCARDLHKTIMNILKEAYRQHYRRIAMPAISAGIHGVPKKLCAEMYVKAFLDFDRQYPRTISEVHFIDVDQQILGLVKSAHIESSVNPHSLDFNNARKYLSAPRLAYPKDRGPGDTAAGKKNPPSTTATASYVTLKKDSTTSYGVRMFTFQIMSKMSVHVYTGSIVKLQKLDGIVCAIDGYQLTGKLAAHIGEVAGEKYRNSLAAARIATPYKDGEVLVTEAGKLGVKKVLHVVVTHAETMTTRFNKLLQFYNRQVLEKANNKKIKKIAMPLLACGRLRGRDDIGLACQELVNTIVEYCETKGDRGLNITDLHLVNMEDDHTDILCRLLKSSAGLEEYDVTSDRSNMSQHGRGDGTSHQASGQFSNSDRSTPASDVDTTTTSRRSHIGQLDSGQFHNIGRSIPASDFDTTTTSRESHIGHLKSGQFNTIGRSTPASDFDTTTTSRRSHIGRLDCRPYADDAGSDHGYHGQGLPTPSIMGDWQTHTPRHIDTTHCVMKVPAKIAAAKPKVQKTKSGHCEYYESCKSQSVENLPCGHEYCAACVIVLGPDKECLECPETGETAADKYLYCTICMDDLTDPEALICGHVFCADCLKQALAHNPVCPLCRILWESYPSRAPSQPPTNCQLV